MYSVTVRIIWNEISTHVYLHDSELPLSYHQDIYVDALIFVTEIAFSA